MLTKFCKKCSTEKPTTEFYTSSSGKDGLQYQCKACTIRHVKERYKNKNYKAVIKSAQRRLAHLYILINKIKVHYGCIICGEKCAECLDCHHIDTTTKDICVSEQITKKNLLKTITELTKCVVICSNCHRKLHSNLLTLPPYTMIDINVVMSIVDEWYKSLGLHRIGNLYRKLLEYKNDILTQNLNN